MGGNKDCESRDVKGDEEKIVMLFLSDLANYIDGNGYTTWEERSVTKPFLWKSYLFVPLWVVKKLLKKYGISTRKMARMLRECEKYPFVTHTNLAVWVSFGRGAGKVRNYMVWVFEFEELMKYRK